METLKALLVTVLRRMGWLLVLGGLAPIAVHVYDRITTRDAVALVTSVDEYCRPGPCQSCRYLQSTCLDALTDTRLAADLVRRRFALLTFRGPEGRSVAARASLARLGADGLRAGDRMQIRYRADQPSVVRPMKVSTVVLAGLLVSAIGIALLVFTRARRPALAGGPNAPAPPHPWHSGGPLSAASGVGTSVSSTRSETASRSSDPVPRRVPQVAIATRRHRQGRNRWIL